MIIHTIKATNVLKYASLDISNLPESGKIAISGDNESGKTALVETIAFALFGQTFSNDTNHIMRTIRWGESSCTAEIEFTGLANTRYTVTRSVDKQGTHSAELFLTGSDTPYATGPQAVLDEVINVCGFDFEQYLDSLYLAQMEITSSESQAETIRAIAGASPFETINQDLQREIDLEKASLETIEDEQTRIEAQIASLDLNQGRLSEIDAEKQQISEQRRIYTDEINQIQQASTQIRDTGTGIQESGHALTTAGQSLSVSQWQAHLAANDDAIERMREQVNQLDMDSSLRSGGELKHYNDKLSARLANFTQVEEQAHDYRNLISHQLGESSKSDEQEHQPLTTLRSRLKLRLFGQRSFQRLLQLLFILAALTAVAAGLSWLVLTQFPGTSMEAMVQDGLRHMAAMVNSEYLLNVKTTTLVAVIVTVIFLVLSLLLGHKTKATRTELLAVSDRLQTVRAQADLIDNMRDQPLPDVIEALTKLDHPSLHNTAERFKDTDGSAFVTASVYADHQQHLNNLLYENANQTAELRELIATRIADLQQLDEQLQQKIAQLNREIEDIETRQKEAQDLQNIIDNMQPRLQEHQQRIRVRMVATQLTDGTCKQIYTQFNKVLSKYTALVMPKLTEGRYKQIQIDDDLQARVFATEKNDFADMDELSSGTQRQIMLALRLAISKALVEAGQQGKQFIILDEPFAFFDRERIRSTINALASIDKNITQFFIITQEFESPEQFDLNIECLVGKEELVVSG